mmetsp:Transcript_70079/g.222136  ORF Transcript_70079/g.222136 Transcript_70079/m.222136 type:complete len:208 (-) Transcript_70079:97-720(-)
MSKTSPSTMVVSSTVPPSFWIRRTSRRSTLSGREGSTQLRTQSTAMGARRLEYWDTTFELRDVVALLMRASRSLRSTGRDMLWRTLHPCWAALFMASEMMVGWMPRASMSMAFFRSAPQRTVTEVVPSPATTSWDLESSTSIFAAGCETSILSRIVAPSLVMITSPLASWTILSIPLGPSDVRTASATALAASMLPVRMSSFFLLSL